MSIHDALRLLHLPNTEIGTSKLQQALEHALERAKFDEIPVLLDAYRTLEGHLGRDEGTSTRQENLTGTAWLATPETPVTLDPWEDDPSITVSDIRTIEPSSLLPPSIKPIGSGPVALGQFALSQFEPGQFAPGQFTSTPWLEAAGQAKKMVIDDLHNHQFDPSTQTGQLQAGRLQAGPRSLPHVIKMQPANGGAPKSRRLRVGVPAILAVCLTGLLLTWVYHPFAQSVISAMVNPNQDVLMGSDRVQIATPTKLKAGSEPTGLAPIQSISSNPSLKPTSLKNPEAVKPEITKPDMIRPTAIKPTGIEPDVIEPTAIKPATMPAKASQAEKVIRKQAPNDATVTWVSAAPKPNKPTIKTPVKKTISTQAGSSKAVPSKTISSKTISSKTISSKTISSKTISSKAVPQKPNSNTKQAVLNKPKLSKPDSSKPNKPALKPIQARTASKPISNKPGSNKPALSKPALSKPVVQTARAKKPIAAQARTKPVSSKPRTNLISAQATKNAVRAISSVATAKPLRVSNQPGRSTRTRQASRTPTNTSLSRAKPKPDTSITNPIKLAASNVRDGAARRAIANPKPVTSFQAPKATGRIENLSREEFGQRYFNRKLYEVWQRDGAQLRYGTWDEIPLEIQVLENNLFRSGVYLNGPKSNDLKDNEKPR
jgi:hypothetical protein